MARVLADPGSVAGSRKTRVVGGPSPGAPGRRRPCHGDALLLVGSGHPGDAQADVRLEHPTGPGGHGPGRRLAHDGTVRYTENGVLDGGVVGDDAAL